MSDVITKANNGEVDKLTLVGDKVEVTKKGETKPSEVAFKEATSSIYDQGLEKGKTKVEIKQESRTGDTWINLLVNIGLPVVLFGLFFLFMMRASQGRGTRQ